MIPQVFTQEEDMEYLSERLGLSEFVGILKGLGGLLSRQSHLTGLLFEDSVL